MPSDIQGSHMSARKVLKYLPETVRHRIIRSKIDVGFGAPKNIIFKLADSIDELEQAFHVLHDAYVEQGYMEPHPSGLRVTKYHALPTTAVLIAKDTSTGQVIATISVVRNTPLGLPLDAIFPLEDLKKKYRHLAEVSSLAIRKEYRKAPKDLLWPLLRYFYKYVKDHMRIDAYVIGVNPSWHDLYAGLLGFTKLEGFQASSYSFVNNAPVAAYIVDTAEQEHIFYKLYAHTEDRMNFFKYFTFYKLTGPQYNFPKKRYFSIQNTVMTKEYFEYFFIQKTNSLSLLSQEEKEIVQRYYPSQEYSPIIFGDDYREIRHLRSENRFITRLSAQMMVNGTFENEVEITVVDFSARGLKIECNIDVPQQVELRLGIGQYDSSYVTAVLRRKSSSSYGLEIIKWDEAWDHFVTEMNLQFESPMNSEGAKTKDELQERRLLANTAAAQRRKLA